MKKFIILLALLFYAPLIYAADQKISARTEDTAPTGDDIIGTVNDPAGTAGDRKVTLDNLAASVPFSIFQLLSQRGIDGGYVALKIVSAPPGAGSCVGAELIIDTTNNRAYICHGAGEDPIDVGEFADSISGFNDGSNSATASGAQTAYFGRASGLSKETEVFQGTTAFTNQPSNDGVECVSSNAGDTTQSCVIYGTTTGGDSSDLTIETIALNGTTPVASVKTNWGDIKAIRLSATAAGTVTIREASADQTITTITAGNTRAANLHSVIYKASGGGVAPVIRPYSSVPVTAGFVYSKVYNSEEELMHVTDATTLTTNAIWRLRFQIPQALPSGTAKVRLLGRANATSGVVKVDPKWCSAAVEEAVCTVVSETTQTVTWGAGDTNQRKELKVTLDADTVVAAEIVEMDLTFVDTDFTLAVESGWNVSIIWE